MKSYIGFPVIGLLFLSLNACTSANYHSIYRNAGLVSEGHVISVDAKQRVILSSKVTTDKTIIDPNQSISKSTGTSPTGTAPTGTAPTGKDGHALLKLKNETRIVRRFCAEPSPDVFSALAQAMSGNGKISADDAKTLSANLAFALSSSEQGSTIPRTQTINMLREVMYRTCERYLSGGYDETELSVQAVRDQRLMVSILAIEQLTGVISPQSVKLSSSSSASSINDSDVIVRVDEAKKALSKAKVITVDKKKVYTDLNSSKSGACDGYKGKTAPDKDPELAIFNECNSTYKDFELAEKEELDLKAHYDLLAKSLAKLTQTSHATSDATESPPPKNTEKPVDAQNSKTIVDVSGIVKQIVDKNFSDNTEVMLFCLRTLRDPLLQENTEFKNHCIDFLNTNVSAAKEKIIAGMREEESSHQRRDDIGFTVFWSKYGGNNKKSELLRILDAKLADSERASYSCMEQAKIQSEYKKCYGNLPERLKNTEEHKGIL